MTRHFLLPLALRVTILLIAIASYWGLEVLLATIPDYDRGVWEGAAIATILLVGNDLVVRLEARRGAKSR